MLDSDTWLIELLASNGFSYKCIRKRLRRKSSIEYSDSQIASVLHRAEIRIRDYRNGDTQEAKGVLRRLTVPALKIAESA